MNININNLSHTTGDARPIVQQAAVVAIGARRYDLTLPSVSQLQPTARPALRTRQALQAAHARLGGLLLFLFSQICRASSLAGSW